MATKKKTSKIPVAPSPKKMVSAEDKRKATRLSEGTASRKTVSRQFNKDQSITVFGKKVPKGIAARSGKLRPKRYNESELGWMMNTTKESAAAGVRNLKKLRKKLG